MGWGGKRRGAGRKPADERAGVPHVKRPRLVVRFPVLVTMRLRGGLESLRTNEAHALVSAAFVAGSSEEFRVIEFSVQSNHVHALVEARNEDALTRGMTGLAVRIARGLNRLLRRVGSVFSDRFHARILRTPREVRNALLHVLHNARKHGSWQARAPDPYSSGASFDGWKEGVGKVAESSARLLARARTWLLSIGWRRHGLIEPREEPCASPAPG